MVATAVQEKNRFTTQLTCFKDGRKVCIYIYHFSIISFLYVVFILIHIIYHPGETNDYIQSCTGEGGC